MPKDKNSYFKEWRMKNPHKWHLIQLKWYYRNKERILAGQRKPGMEDDEYSLWQRRFD